MNTTTTKITAVMGILLDLRGIDPAVTAGFSTLARKHQVVPLHEPFRCPVVVMGEDGERYDAAALGHAVLRDMDR